MRKLKNILGISIVAAVALIGISCNGQLGEANKLVDEANAAIKKSNETASKSSGLIKELFGDLSKVEDLGDAGSKFEAASKLDVSAKFKEYLTLKGQEIKKRSDLDKATTDFVKAFQGEKETEKVDTLIGDYNKKSGDLSKEADDLMKKADQIVKDNPAEFKSN